MIEDFENTETEVKDPDGEVVSIEDSFNQHFWLYEFS